MTMIADAGKAWPGILAAINPAEGFKMAEAAAMKGRVFRFRAVRNRSGWDFDGKYDFAIWLEGAVLAGSYEPAVAAAMNEAAKRIRRSVDDHIDWDVIAVIEGPGTINKRVFTEVIDQKTRDVLAKLESYHPIACVLVRVIALHAGPVAAGAKPLE